MQTDGWSDIKTYSTAGMITGETIKYAAGAADISDTTAYTAGVLPPRIQETCSLDIEKA